ncbi:MAG: GNAT family N-acetyltransferase [Rhodospirillum sp.]|nr:GNAT family N-acetyltransferase [Rhodospirillum sp.]MCF8491204.1 GNAT family N-acetyltransferase [Rhodospirillum sp.]MCF8503092.1 GNAT family N-acetyltransferase [Rhodospirillum sp.]
MPDSDDSLVLHFHTGIDEISAEDWDACAGPDNPFCLHAFLSALESSGAVAPATGWGPRHVTVRDGRERILACAPLYLKGHSYGEYVFDWAWARAYEQAGGKYYPKLQCAIPFTPVTGPRLMVRDGAGDPDMLRRTLVAGMVEMARRLKVSSLHVTFPTKEEHDLMVDMGLLSRLGRQYHWENAGYGGFDDFLAALSSRKRKTIRKEREKAQSQGVTLKVLTGDAIEPRHWEAFHHFYLSTIDKKWSQAYLNKAFFHRLGATMADRVALVMGEDDATGELVCGALNLIGGDALYGRNWGASEDYKFLHFEACYYQAMDFAIDRGLRWVEAGAQGEHKISRGYLPRFTYSTHWIADQGFHRAVEDFLDKERDAVAEDMEMLGELAPFKCTE